MKKSKIILTIAATIALTAALTACGVKNDNVKPSVTDTSASSQAETALPTGEVTSPSATESTATETIVPTPAVTMTPAQTEAPTEIPTEVPTEVPTEIPTEVPTEEPTAAPTETPFERPMVKFDDMDYSRPDEQTVIKQIDKIREIIDAGKETTDKILERLSHFIGTEIADWNTMYAITNIKFSIEPHSEKWSGEMQFFNENNPKIENKFDSLLVSCAKSKYKEAIETQLLGEGMLDPYVDGPLYTEKLAALKQQEAELVTEYEAFDINSMVFDVSGYHGTIEEIIQQLISSGHMIDRYDIVMNSIQQEITGKTGRILVDLIKVRHAIAAEAGYDNYEEYAFAEELGRDYSPAQAAALAEAIRDKLAPLVGKFTESGQFIDDYIQYLQDPPMVSYGEIMEFSEKGFADIDASFTEALEYMQELELCYLGYDEEQVGMSFTTFIQNYFAPYIVIQGDSSISDLLTFVHEFGHFYDNYYNLGTNANLDVSEVPSTALVYLFSRHLDKISGFNEQQRKAYASEMKMDALETFISQAMYYLFEHRAYALSDDEVTVKKLNSIARDLGKEFGIEDSGFDSSWPFITHFYMQPFYVISYVTSSMVSIQMYDKEVAKAGSGLDVYLDFVGNFDPYEPFLECVDRVGLRSPFADGSVDALVTSISKMLS